MQNRRCLTFLTYGILQITFKLITRDIMQGVILYAQITPTIQVNVIHCRKLLNQYKLGHWKGFSIHLYLSWRKCNTNIWLNSCNLHFRSHSTSPSVKLSSFRITATLSGWIRRRWRRKNSFEWNSVCQRWSRGIPTETSDVAFAIFARRSVTYDLPSCAI